MKFGFWFLLFFSTLTAQTSAAIAANLLLEPTLTFENGESTVNYPAPLKSSTGRVEGLGAGLRVAAHFYQAFFVGVDGRYSIPQVRDSSLNQESTATSFNYGPVVGLTTPLGFRFWVSYVMDSMLDPEKDQNIDAKFDEGSGYRLGAGYQWGIASLNLEYQLINYENAQIEEAGVFSPGTSLTDVELKNRTWIFSVSFPVNF